MITLMTLALALIKCLPFILAVWIITIVVRAVFKGEVKTGGKGSPIETKSRSFNPIRFWVEIGLYCALAAFLTLNGLLWFDHAPHWFRDLMFNRSKGK